MLDYQSMVFGLIEEDPAIFAAAIFNKNGEIQYQTNNWDISHDISGLVKLIWEENTGSVEITTVNYIVVEYVPERIIATNVGHKGHVIIIPMEDEALICYIDPNQGPRDALQSVQLFAQKLKEYT